MALTQAGQVQSYTVPGTELSPTDYTPSHILTHTHGTGTVFLMG